LKRCFSPSTVLFLVVVWDAVIAAVIVGLSLGITRLEGYGGSTS